MSKIILALAVICAVASTMGRVQAAEGAVPEAAVTAAAPDQKAIASMTAEELLAYLKTLSAADFAKTVASAVVGTDLNFSARMLTAAQTVINQADSKTRAAYLKALSSHAEALEATVNPDTQMTTLTLKKTTEQGSNSESRFAGGAPVGVKAGGGIDLGDIHTVSAGAKR